MIDLPLESVLHAPTGNDFAQSPGGISAFFRGHRQTFMQGLGSPKDFKRRDSKTGLSQLGISASLLRKHQHAIILVDQCTFPGIPGFRREGLGAGRVPELVLDDPQQGI